MRVRVEIPPPPKTVQPCIREDCPNPLGGNIPKGRRYPTRRHGLCHACYRRKEGNAPLPVRMVERCKDPDCPRPSGGPPKRKGGKIPCRKAGYCLTCFKKHEMRWKRANGLYKDKRRAGG